MIELDRLSRPSLATQYPLPRTDPDSNPEEPFVPPAATLTYPSADPETRFILSPLVLSLDHLNCPQLTIYSSRCLPLLAQLTLGRISPALCALPSSFLLLPLSLRDGSLVISASSPTSRLQPRPSLSTSARHLPQPCRTHLICCKRSSGTISKRKEVTFLP